MAAHSVLLLACDEHYSDVHHAFLICGSRISNLNESAVML